MTVTTQRFAGGKVGRKALNAFCTTNTEVCSNLLVQFSLRLIPSVSPQVLLLPVKAGGGGLTLTEASHIFLLDPILSAADFEQVAGRVHRFGQTQPTYVHTLRVKDSVEEAVYKIAQDRAEKAGSAGIATTATSKGKETEFQFCRTDIVTMVRHVEEYHARLTSQG